MALTNNQRREWAKDLFDSLSMNGETSSIDISGGREIKLEIVLDEFRDLNEDDCYGMIHPVEQNRYTGYDKRPDGFNGAARKFDTRDGRYWWQPPTDLANDPDNCAKLFKIVRDYYNGDWCFVGLSVSLSIPCDCRCQEHYKTIDCSLWGIESNADDDSMIEIIYELIGEVYSDERGYRN